MLKEIDYDLGLWYAFHSTGRSPHISVETFFETMEEFEDDYTEYARGCSIPNSEKWVLVKLDPMESKEAYLVDQETMETMLWEIQDELEQAGESVALAPTVDYSGNIDERTPSASF